MDRASTPVWTSRRSQRPSGSSQTAVNLPVAQRDKPREKALSILRSVENGVFADALIEQARPDFGTRDNAFILELVYGTLRNRTHLDWMLNGLSERPVERTDRWTRNILRLGAYQLLFLDRVPASAAVNTSTELAKQHGRKHAYVNGLLRNLERNRSSIRLPDGDDPAKRLSIVYSHPEWLVRRWLKRFGEEAAESMLRLNNRPAPLMMRANSLRTTRDELMDLLRSQGVKLKPARYSPQGIEIMSSPGISVLPAYGEGLFMVQDEAAQLIGMMLSPRPGEAILDACAAPGGKAAHLAELMQNEGSLVALEKNPDRLKRLVDNINRLGLTIVDPVRGDAAGYTNELFDRILIDAPCSGFGVLRRHPDSRWNKDERALKRHQRQQRQILENCSTLLKPGGVLVYATCTTEPEENESVIEWFLDNAGREFVIEDPGPYLPVAAAHMISEKGFFHTYPDEPELDGFFGVRMITRR